MKIGVDIHGVIDRYPIWFRLAINDWLILGNEIHIITGQEEEKAKKILKRYQIQYTHFYSIVDFHKKIGTEMWLDEKGTWWMDKDIWNASKGAYARSVNLDLHFDDSLVYCQYFPEDCTCIIVPKENFERFELAVATGGI